MTDKLKGGRIWNSLGLLFCLAATSACAPDPSAFVSLIKSGTVELSSAPAPLTAAKPAAAPAAKAQAPVARASAPAFPVNSTLQPDQRLEHGDYVWEEEGVPAGRMTMVVDLKAQILYVYRGGVEIGRSAILYGADDKPTPTGTFNILEKKRHHVSNLYGAPMPYMMRLTWDGVAIHGSEVEWGSATHGCVGVPSEFAALLFAAARKGDPVLVTNRWRTDLYGV
jgi:lipoprotein-anchoring transpeptidase ErfK/SrfK